MTVRRILAICTAAVLFAVWAAPAGALGLFGSGSPLDGLPEDRQPEEPVVLTLTRDWHITGSLALSALDPALGEQFGSLSPAELGEGYFGPGYAAVTQPVTIQAGPYQIIVEAGASLTLEELNPGSSLTVKGTRQDGLFVVKEGGSLTLNQVLVEAPEPAVRLEAGADYEWSNANKVSLYPEPAVEREEESLRALELSPSFQGIGGLRVYGDDPWSDSLPGEYLSALPVVCAIGGVREEEPRLLGVVWDTASAAGDLAARRDCVLTGALLDGAGEPVEADFVPLLPVRFLPRQPVEIRKALWEELSPGRYWGELRFEPPHEAVSAVLERSRDGGAAWEELPVEMSRLGDCWAAGFQTEDASPALYRISVEGGPNAGTSRAVMLPSPAALEDPAGEDGGAEEDSGSDIGGNRGGGTALDTPERELPTQGAPEELPEAAEPDPAPAAPEAPEEAPQEAPGEASSPEAEELPAEVREPLPQEDPAPAEPPAEPAPAEPEDPAAGQLAVAGCGLAACAGAAFLAGKPELLARLLVRIRK